MISRLVSSARARTVVAVAALLALAPAAHGVIFATASGSNINSNGGSSGSSAAGSLTYTFSGLTGAYTLRTVGISGTVERVASSDGAGEKRLSASFAPIPSGYTQPTGFNPTFAAYAGSPPRSTVSNRTWDVPDLLITNGSRVTFRFHESINDGGDSGVDGIWRSFTAAFDGDATSVSAPTPTFNAGTLSQTIAYANTASLFSAGTVHWYRFDLAYPVSTSPQFGNHRSLDITTNWINGSSALDTEIALYDSLGNLIAEDDESGQGSKSALSFGAGSGAVLNPGDSTAVLSTGQNGNLAAGTYYLAVTQFNANFAQLWNVSSGSSSGAYTLTLAAGLIPEPASVGVLAPAGALLLRRRR